MIEKRVIEDWTFSKVADIEIDRDETGHASEFVPQPRFENTKGLAVHKYGGGPFCKFKLAGIPASAGVYVFVVDDDVAYVGETHFAPQTLAGYRSISPRMCFRGGQERSCRINNLIYDASTRGARISLWFMLSDERKGVEAALRRALKPVWNRV